MAARRDVNRPAINKLRHPERSRFILRRHPDRSRFSGEGRDLARIAGEPKILETPQ
jgi:hypothetical protein